MRTHVSMNLKQDTGLKMSFGIYKTHIQKHAGGKIRAELAQLVWCLFKITSRALLAV